MKFCNYLIISILSILFIFNNIEEVLAQKVRYGYSQDDDGTVYKSLNDALKNPEKVYRLKLTGKRMDSIPEAVFKFYNLRELTIKNCKLQIINQNIGKLSQLIYLNVSANQLVRLPRQIADLKELKGLVISRNKICELPESIGTMSKLEIIDAWDNPLYVLPESMANMTETLKIIDLRQIPLWSSEIDAMEKLLPKTNVLTTSYCDCSMGGRK